MCGIMGYIGEKQAAPVLLEGLNNLEYRGYDSSGIAVRESTGELKVNKASGKLARLVESIGTTLPEGNVGIGHTRWATHGGATDYNAHPHADCHHNVMVAHNGIVENYSELRTDLAAKGHVFRSETDSEIIPHLIEVYISRGCTLDAALLQTAQHIRGAHAIVAICRESPQQIVALRLGNAGGLVIGYGNNAMLIASDLSPLLTHTDQVAYLSDGELVILTNGNARFHRLDGTPVQKTPVSVPYNSLSTAKGLYKHFMLKEILEQPEAVMSSIRGHLSFDPPDILLNDLNFHEERLVGINKLVLLGMGTSLHAAMVGRLWAESIAQIHAEADNSSEFRYRNPIIDQNTLVVSISQSGETADTLAAMEEAARKGAMQIALCNAEGSQATRIADASLYIRAGLEVGVASTKTFICSLVTLYLLVAYLGLKRGSLNNRAIQEVVHEVASLPQMLGSILGNQQIFKDLSLKYFKHSNFIYLGRGLNYPIAIEGALKLKEISYIHAEGYPAGEMKHGPIALINEHMPVVVLATKGPLYDKMISNINEVKSRGGIVIAVATEGDSKITAIADHTIHIPEASPEVTPILTAVPLQLLAYHIAILRGSNVDQPRNLAKSVTVE